MKQMYEPKPHIDDSGFDALMDQVFLNLDLDDPRNTVITEAVSNTFLIERSAIPSRWSFKKIFLTFFSLFILLGTISIIGIYISPKTKKDTIGQPANPLSFPDSAQLHVTPEIKTPVQSALTHYDTNRMVAVNTKTDQLLLLIDTVVVQPLEDRYLPMYSEPQITTDMEIKETNKPIFVFPQLTDKEIRANNKQRKKMLDHLLRLGKSKYLLIPQGTHLYNGEVKTIKSCYMSQTEVSNLEYRTFLFDLLIQGKKEEFLTAKPQQALWMNSNGTSTFDNLKDLYFSEKKFNDYPVVNISIEGAKLYCKWLNDMYEDAVDKKEQTKRRIKIDIPRESEWIYSALGSFKNASYPWGTDSIQNHTNCFLANFCIQKLTDQLYRPYGYTYKVNTNSYTSAGLALNDRNTATAKVGEYNPNWYGLYCMSGNVSEMVFADQTLYPKALGGNWGSDFEHLKINCTDEFKGKVSPSPFIGFRPVIHILENK